MGMFDTIQWGDNLPFSGEMKVLGLDKNNWSFQTKDLHCCLDTYIVQDGHLFLQKYKDQSWVEGDPKAESLMDRMGFLKRVDPYLEAQKGLTETICMYDYRQDVDGLWDCTIDFKVVFVYGMVESVELTKFDKRSNSERKQQELEWKRNSNITILFGIIVSFFTHHPTSGCANISHGPFIKQVPSFTQFPINCHEQ